MTALVYPLQILSVILNPRRRASLTKPSPGTATSSGTAPWGVWPRAIICLAMIANAPSRGSQGNEIGER